MGQRTPAIHRLVGRRHRRRRECFEPPGDQVIVHCAHHKVGTVWFHNILSALAGEFGLRYRVHESGESEPEPDVLLYWHSRNFDPAHAGGRPIRGTHMIRDPRDVAVSAYHYHLWTKEEWVHLPIDRFGGRSYQEHLNSVDAEEGLGLEIQHTCVDPVYDMLTWDYGRDDFLELRYEDLVQDERALFASVFRHYGLTREATERALALVEQASFRNITGREIGEVGTQSHLRSGRPGEWREHFQPSHVALWKEHAPGSLVQLGYEPDEQWS